MRPSDLLKKYIHQKHSTRVLPLRGIIKGCYPFTAILFNMEFGKITLKPVNAFVMCACHSSSVYTFFKIKFYRHYFKIKFYLQITGRCSWGQ